MTKFVISLFFYAALTVKSVNLLKIVLDFRNKI